MLKRLTRALSPAQRLMLLCIGYAVLFGLGYIANYRGYYHWYTEPEAFPLWVLLPLLMSWFIRYPFTAAQALAGGLLTPVAGLCGILLAGVWFRSGHVAGPLYLMLYGYFFSPLNFAWYFISWGLRLWLTRKEMNQRA